MRAEGNLDLLLRVAKRLDGLKKPLAYVGGAILDLLVTDAAAPKARPTDDVDVVIEVFSTADYFSVLRTELTERGFKEDTREGAPLCRWIVDDVTVDVMPPNPSVLGFANRWYPLALQTAETHPISGVNVRLISAPCFVATKLEAFRGRGHDDYQASHDLEDIISVIMGRSALIEEITAAPMELRDYLANETGRLLGIPEFVDALPGHLPGDRESQALLPLLVERLRAIARR